MQNPISKTLLTAVCMGISSWLFAQSDSAAYFLQKGLDEKEKGRRLESMKQFEKAYQYNAADKNIINELALAYYDLRRYGQSREKYQKLEQLGDQSALTYK